MKKFKLKKGDKVIVLTGKDKGKIGDILEMHIQDDKALVSGVNEVKKHQKPSRSSQGGIVTKLMPVHISNIAFYDEKSKKASRVGFKILKDGEKKRFAKRSDEIIG